MLISSKPTGILFASREKDVPHVIGGTPLKLYTNIENESATKLDAIIDRTECKYK
jgi:hypothetical protein